MTNSVAYETVEPVLNELGSTWSDARGERSWMRYAWCLLSDRGLTAVDQEDSRNEVVLWAVALWALTKVFYAKEFDEGREQDWWYSVALAVGNPPFIAATWIVEQVRDRYDLSADSDEDGGETDGDEIPEDLVDDVLLTLVRDAAGEVGVELRKALGEAGLYAALSRSRSSETTYPLDEDATGDALDGSTLSSVGAYGWVVNDLSI